MSGAMTNTLPLRRAIPADAPAIRALTRAAYARWVPILGREPMPMTADYDLAVREHLIDLLEPDGQLAALVEMSVEADHLLIVNLAVAAERQRQGFGSRLLAHAETVAAAEGRSTLRLYTNGLMATNVALYQARGYAIDRIEARTPTWSVVHMLKRLE
jgi:ribosomal protein S18 acetylase RimI-like enzyme